MQITIGVLLLCVLTTVSLSRSARSALKGVISGIVAPTVRSSPASGPLTSPAASATLDVEQRARAAHGWSNSIATSVAQGSIIYYDSSGRATGQYAITLTRGYPDRVRVDINRGSSDASGFDQTSAWEGGVVNLTDVQARDIRAVARFCPERLFVERDAGAPYREAGQRIEDPAPPGTLADWTTASSIASPSQTVFDQVEMTDSLGPVPTKSNPGDVRRIYYYVDSATSLVSTARWLEPDSPRKSIDDATAAFTDIRVDFGDWRDVNGVKLPFKVTHSTGGRVDFRILWNELTLNQSIPDSIFQMP
jgi:hypothetical protein